MDRGKPDQKGVIIIKHGKRPTVSQRKLIQSKGLDPTVWFVVKDLPDRIELVHRYSDRTKRIIYKGEIT